MLAAWLFQPQPVTNTTGSASVLKTREHQELSWDALPMLWEAAVGRPVVLCKLVWSMPYVQGRSLPLEKIETMAYAPNRGN